MDDSFSNLPLAKGILRRAKVIPIASAKTNPKILEAAFERIDEELLAGRVVCIFPEGCITKTGELNAFRGGVEKILARRPVSVVPLGLKGMWGSLFSRAPKEAKMFPGKFLARIQLRVGGIVAPEKATADFLRDRVGELLT
jgi:1-acyl-sn-glycerol-3-phosphate acyltransferase